jgi:hypothetical protein
MADTYTLISSVTVGAGGAATMSFTSIPSTYTDLKIVASLRDTATGSTGYGFSLVFNNDLTGARYSGRYLLGNGANASSGTVSDYSTSYTYVGGAATSNTFSNTEIYIPNYAGSTQKSHAIDSVTENNATTAFADMWAKLYNQTTAISQIDLYSSGTFAQYSTAYLYGIKNS